MKSYEFWMEATYSGKDSLWDAMKRREVYATTGTRLRVRVLAGFGFTAADMDHSDLAKSSYAKGVPNMIKIFSYRNRTNNRYRT